MYVGRVSVEIFDTDRKIEFQWFPICDLQRKRTKSYGEKKNMQMTSAMIIGQKRDKQGETNKTVWTTGGIGETRLTHSKYIGEEAII